MFIWIFGTRIILLRSVVPVFFTEIQFRDSKNLFLALKNWFKKQLKVRTNKIKFSRSVSLLDNLGNLQNCIKANLTSTIRFRNCTTLGRSVYVWFVKTWEAGRISLRLRALWEAPQDVQCCCQLGPQLWGITRSHEPFFLWR